MKKNLIVTIYIILGVIGIAYILMHAFSVNSQYNNDFCNKCNSKANYVLVDIEKSKDNIGTFYYYECQNCGHIIQICKY